MIDTVATCRETAMVSPSNAALYEIFVISGLYVVSCDTCRQDQAFDGVAIR
jgi:hypothetical protein